MCANDVGFMPKLLHSVFFVFREIEVVEGRVVEFETALNINLSSSKFWQADRLSIF